MRETNNFQRIGAPSNTVAGREFGIAAFEFFQGQGLKLSRDFPAPVGFTSKKTKKFDLGSEAPPVLVECKSYTWTSGGNSPSAKIRGLNEVMLLFSVAPSHYRKILFVLKHLHDRTGESLASHYVRCNEHLIGAGVEIWEFDTGAKKAHQVR